MSSRLHATFDTYGVAAAGRVLQPRSEEELRELVAARDQDVDANTSVLTKEEEFVLINRGTFLTGDMRDKFLFHTRLNILDLGLSSAPFCSSFLCSSPLPRYASLAEGSF